jgi:hypothetical protein
MNAFVDALAFELVTSQPTSGYTSCFITFSVSMNSKDNLGMRWYSTRVSVFSQGLQRKEVGVIKRAG